MLLYILNDVHICVRQFKISEAWNPKYSFSLSIEIGVTATNLLAMWWNDILWEPIVIFQLQSLLVQVAEIQSVLDNNILHSNFNRPSSKSSLRFSDITLWMPCNVLTSHVVYILSTLQQLALFNGRLAALSMAMSFFHSKNSFYKN